MGINLPISVFKLLYEDAKKLSIENGVKQKILIDDTFSKVRIEVWFEFNGNSWWVKKINQIDFNK